MTKDQEKGVSDLDIRHILDSFPEAKQYVFIVVVTAATIIVNYLIAKL